MNERSVEQQRLRTALLWSACALVAIVVLVVVVLLLLQSPDQVETVEEKPVSAIVVEREQTPVPKLSFSDVTTESGIDFVHENGAQGERLLPETMGGGVALFDYDLDDDLDLLFINSNVWDPTNIEVAKQPRSQLYANDGTGQFTDVTENTLELSTYGMAPAIGDVNGDGFPDVFVTALGENHLFLNERGERFIDVTETYGVRGSDTAFSSCATFIDFDRDDDLDLFVCNYVGWSETLDKEVDFRLTGVGRAYGPPTDFPGSNSWLYRNEGGMFTEVSKEAGLHVQSPQTGEPVGKALAVSVTDVNADGWPDLVVANDTVRNFLFVNRQDGTFVEQGIEYGIAFDPSGAATGAMGLDAANYMNDQRLGIAIGNFANEMTSFYVSSDNANVFSDDAIVVGIGAPTRKVLTFGLFFFDADLDGRQDFFSVNGHIEPEISAVQASQSYAQEPQLFWNCGPQCRRPYVLLSDMDDGLSVVNIGRGAVYGDIDADGDLDIVLTNVGDSPRFLRNDLGAHNNWINIGLRYKAPNLFGIGSTIKLETDHSTQYRYITRTRSYLSQFDASAHFGLGPMEQVMTITVTWPDGEIERLESVEINRKVLLGYGLINGL